MNFRNLLMVGLVSAMALVGCGGGSSTDGGTGGGSGGGAMGGGTGGGSMGGGTGGGAMGGGTGGGAMGGGTGGGAMGGGSGGGGGTTDGGTGGGGGGSVTCETIASVGPDIAGGNYFMYLRDGGVRTYQNWEGDVYIPHSDGGVDLMFVERWWQTSTGTPPTFPTLGVMIPANNTINDCLDCVYYLEGCTQNFSSCGKMYFATGGTLNYLTGDANPDAGVFSGNGAAIQLKEWDCANFLTGVGNCADTAVTGGGCKDVAAFQWDAGWP